MRAQRTAAGLSDPRRFDAGRVPAWRSSRPLPELCPAAVPRDLVAERTFGAQRAALHHGCTSAYFRLRASLEFAGFRRARRHRPPYTHRDQDTSARLKRARKRESARSGRRGAIAKRIRGSRSCASASGWRGGVAGSGERRGLLTECSLGAITVRA